jgi:hypothetical protein
MLSFLPTPKALQEEPWGLVLRFTHISCRQSAQIELIRDEFSKQSRAASHPPFLGRVGVSAPGRV